MLVGIGLLHGQLLVHPIRNGIQRQYHQAFEVGRCVVALLQLLPPTQKSRETFGREVACWSVIWSLEDPQSRTRKVEAGGY